MNAWPFVIAAWTLTIGVSGDLLPHLFSHIFDDHIIGSDVLNSK